MKKIISIAAVVASAVVALSTANAATPVTLLGAVQGSVMVNQGDVYEPALAGKALNAGDQLLVLQGGEALVNYASGCQVTLGGNEVLRIGTEDACSTPAAAAVNQAIGSTSSSGGGTGSGGGGTSTGDLIGLGATLAAAGYAAYEISDNDDPDISR